MEQSPQTGRVPDPFSSCFSSSGSSTPSNPELRKLETASRRNFPLKYLGLETVRSSLSSLASDQHFRGRSLDGDKQIDIHTFVRMLCQSMRTGEDHVENDSRESAPPNLIPGETPGSGGYIGYFQGNWGVMAYLTPFMEQSAVFGLLNLESPTYANCASATTWNQANERQFAWYSGEIRCASYIHYHTPNSKFYDCAANADASLGYIASGWKAARSNHPDGVNMLLCDGSVRSPHRTGSTHFQAPSHASICPIPDRVGMIHLMVYRREQ
jgi:prepilin-type processing-associated H-X9-DG protein